MSSPEACTNSVNKIMVDCSGEGDTCWYAVLMRIIGDADLERGPNPNSQSPKKADPSSHFNPSRLCCQ